MASLAKLRAISEDKPSEELGSKGAEVNGDVNNEDNDDVEERTDDAREGAGDGLNVTKATAAEAASTGGTGSSQSRPAKNKLNSKAHLMEGGMKAQTAQQRGETV